MQEKILVVDDEKEIADLLEVYLINEGYQISKCHNGKAAISLIDHESFDLAILDIMLPDMDGFKICRHIREKYFYPIIMLTAKIEDTDKIMGLTMGADDYITKPFNPLEVLARVKTQLRRYKNYNHATEEVGINNIQQSEYDLRGLILNKASHECSLYGKSIALTPIEFSILAYLLEHIDEVVSSEELFETIWGEKYLNNNNTVMAHIARLREKLKENPKKPKFIKTVWGVGYKIEK